MLALVDCNNFFVSCERLLDSALEDVPVAVLSNNDGCIISRSNEVKAMGVPMGIPYFKCKKQLDRKGVKIFSGNHRYYIEISRRVMEVLKQFSPKVEIYSVDEAFICLKGFNHKDLKEYAQEMRDAVKEQIGIPVSVGVAPTKTLAKIATEQAKKFSKLDSVCILEDNEEIEKALERTEVEDIWGVGRRNSVNLRLSGIGTAADFAQRPGAWVRKKFSVFGLRTVNELNGIVCYPVEETRNPHKSIIVSSSFGRNLVNFDDLNEAVSVFAGRAVEKLRRDRLNADYLTVYLRNNKFSNPDEKYVKSVYCKLPYPTDNTSIIVAHAKKLLKAIYDPKIAYKKAGVVLSGLILQEEEQHNLFDIRSQSQKLRQARQMEVVEKINKRFGRETIMLASQKGSKNWKPKSEMRSETDQIGDNIFQARF